MLSSSTTSDNSQSSTSSQSFSSSSSSSSVSTSSSTSSLSSSSSTSSFWDWYDDWFTNSSSSSSSSSVTSSSSTSSLIEAWIAYVNSSSSTSSSQSQESSSSSSDSSSSVSSSSLFYVTSSSDSYDYECFEPLFPDVCLSTGPDMPVKLDLLALLEDPSTLYRINRWQRWFDNNDVSFTVTYKNFTWVDEGDPFAALGETPNPDDPFAEENWYEPPDPVTREFGGSLSVSQTGVVRYFPDSSKNELYRLRGYTNVRDRSEHCSVINAGYGTCDTPHFQITVCQKSTNCCEVISGCIIIVTEYQMASNSKPLSLMARRARNSKYAMTLSWADTGDALSPSANERMSVHIGRGGAKPFLIIDSDRVTPNGSYLDVGSETTYLSIAQDDLTTGAGIYDIEITLNGSTVTKGTFLVRDSIIEEDSSSSSMSSSSTSSSSSSSSSGP